MNAFARTAGEKGRLRDKLLQLLWKMVKYGLVGTVAALSAWLSSVGSFHFAHLSYVTSQAIGFLVGTLVSFPLSRRWAFQNRSRKLGPQLGVFGLVALSGFGVNALALVVAVRFFHVWVPAAMAIGLMAGFLWNFSLHNLITFRWLR